MVQQVPDMVDKVLNALSQHFGATGSHLWYILMRQQIIGAVVSTIGWGGFFGVLAYVLYRWRDCDDDTRFLFIAGSLLAAFIAVSIIGVNIQVLLNPEYYALHDIADMMK